MANEKFRDSTLSPAERAADLLSRLTLREKVGQVNQRLYGFNSYTRTGDRVELSEDFQKEVERWGGLGVLYGLYRAVRKPEMSVVLTIISLGTRLVLAYILSAIPGIGVVGIWVSVPIGWFLADCTGFAYYWMKRRAILGQGGN